MAKLEMLVRRREKVECHACLGNGRVREKGRHDVHWHDCRRCGGDGETTTWMYYWADSNAPTDEELDEMDGTPSRLFWS